jgi:hypothetical protein
VPEQACSEMPSLPNTRRPHLATSGAVASYNPTASTLAVVVASYVPAASALALAGANHNETLLLDVSR